MEGQEQDIIIPSKILRLDGMLPVLDLDVSAPPGPCPDFSGNLPGLYDFLLSEARSTPPAPTPIPPPAPRAAFQAALQAPPTPSPPIPAAAANNKREKDKSKGTEEEQEQKTKKRIRFPAEVVQILRRWLAAHRHDPYPTDEEKKQLAHETGITVAQVTSWVGNARCRHLGYNCARQKKRLMQSKGKSKTKKQKTRT